MVYKIKIFIEKLIIRFLFRINSKHYKKKRNYTVKPRLFWGPTPIISFSYWNKAMKGAGYPTTSLMNGFLPINKKEDYDLYFEDIRHPVFLKPFIRFKSRFPHLSKLHLVLYIAQNFDIIHTTYKGGIFQETELWKEELLFYKKSGMKLVALPYGDDYQRFSKIYSPSWHHVLLMNFYRNLKKERIINQKIEFLVQEADCIMAGFQYDQVGRWDILPYAIYPIDTEQWKPKVNYNSNDGSNGPVKVYHTPNHKGVKGTEFLLKAVEELKKEGLQVELVLLEKINNEKVRQLLHDDADILVEQLILGYALSAIEGMCTGLPVITNLEEEVYTRVFRRYSFLNECPLLSSSPEKIKDDLRTLVTNPTLRLELGKAGRKYAEKYHSYSTSQAIFNAIYDKIWYNKPVDLINFFNPQNKDSYNNKSEKIIHPLIENKYPHPIKR